MPAGSSLERFTIAHTAPRERREEELASRGDATRSKARSRLRRRNSKRARRWHADVWSQSLNRHDHPRPRRKPPRPLDDNVMRPTRLDSETPDLDRFRNVEGPIRFRRR
jgi:hypothetical protein